MKQPDRTSSHTAPDPASPLSDFYAASNLPVLRFEPMPGCELPEPYQGLLFHDNDMTQVLEAFHAQRLSLQVLNKRLERGVLAREVVLVGDEDQRAVEFGAIRIELDRFEAEPKKRILECRRPLGAIIREFEVEYTSHPTAFFRVRSDSVIRAALGPAGDGWLYGRHNRLMAPRTPTGTGTLAEVVEILPGGLEAR